jgi:hypothetical protein
MQSSVSSVPGSKTSTPLNNDSAQLLPPPNLVRGASNRWAGRISGGKIISDLMVMKAIWDDGAILPPLNRFTLNQLESIKRVMRAFRILNPNILVGTWAFKKMNSDLHYRRRYIWIDPLANAFLWYVSYSLLYYHVVSIFPSQEQA